jgi:anti-anti-sigma regulatory factor/anti-sigma regulatory factor (Ser/Thr protein kinase)
VKIEQTNRDGFVVLTLVGRLDLAAAPQVHRALLEHLDQWPSVILCDLAGVEAIDPVCAGVFSSVRHPELGRAGTVLAVCGARPAVAAVLTRRQVPGRWSLYGTLDEAIAHARVRPPRLRERLTLGPAPAAAGAARAFVRRLCARWELGALAEPAVLVANELVTNAVVHAQTPLELRVELRGQRLQVAVRDGDPRLVRLLATKNAAERGLGLALVNRLATAWGVRQDRAGGKVVWCVLDRSAPFPRWSAAAGDLRAAPRRRGIEQPKSIDTVQEAAVSPRWRPAPLSAPTGPVPSGPQGPVRRRNDAVFESSRADSTSRSSRHTRCACRPRKRHPRQRRPGLPRQERELSTAWPASCTPGPPNWAEATVTRTLPSWSSSASAEVIWSPSNSPAAAALPCWTSSRTTGTPVERSTC